MPTDIPLCPTNSYIQPLHIEIYGGRRASLSFKILEPGVRRDQYIPPLDDNQIRYINKDLRQKGAKGMCQKDGALFAEFKNESTFEQSVRKNPRIYNEKTYPRTYDEKLLLDSDVGIKRYESPAAKEIDHPTEATINPRAMVEWGRFLFDQGDYAEAAAILRKATQSSIALQPLVLFFKGLSELRLYELHRAELPGPALENLEAAVEDLQEFAESIPQNPLGWRALGKALYQLSFEYDDEFQKREKKDLQHAAFAAMMHAFNQELMRELASDVKEEDQIEWGTHPADFLLELGSVASELGYYAIAKSSLGNLEQFAPIAGVLKELVNLDVKHIQGEKTRHASDKAEYFKRLAKVHLAVSDSFPEEKWTRASTERAFYFLKQAQKLNPKDFETALIKGTAYLRLEDYDTADDIFKEAIQLDDGNNYHILRHALITFGLKNVDALRHLGMFFYRLSGQRPEEPKYREVAFSALTYSMARLADDEGIEAEAKNSLSDSAYVELLMSLVTVAVEQEEFGTAINYLDKADRLDRIESEYFQLMGRSANPTETEYGRELHALERLKITLLSGVWGFSIVSTVNHISTLIQLLFGDYKTKLETDDTEDIGGENGDSNNTPVAPTGTDQTPTPTSPPPSSSAAPTGITPKDGSQPTTSLGSFDIRDEESAPAAAVRSWRSAAALYRRRNSRGRNSHRSGPPYEVMRSPAFGAPGQQFWNELFLSVRPSGFPVY
jgi:tetratricopeptide (TPR) repeat protein